jgi:esterase/lipase superfamily enzyme
VGLRALQSGEDFDGKIDNVLLTASAVDDEVLEKNKEFYPALDRCQRIFSYSSKNDPVVKTAYRLGDFPEFDAALGYHGTEHPDRLARHSERAYMIDCSEQVKSHGGYRQSAEFFGHWKKVLDEVTEFPQFMFLDGTPDPRPGQ